jgi:hypothetical protein
MTDDRFVSHPEPLRGYRKLSDEEKALVDEIKRKEQEIGRLWAKVQWSQTSTRDAGNYAHSARRLFRLAFVELVRVVTKPVDPYTEGMNEILYRENKGTDTNDG